MYIYEDTILNFVLENRVPVSDIEGCESGNVSHFTKYFNNIFQNIYRDFHYIIAYQPRNVGCNDHNEFETCNAVKKNIFLSNLFQLSIPPTQDQTADPTVERSPVTLSCTMPVIYRKVVPLYTSETMGAAQSSSDVVSRKIVLPRNSRHFGSRNLILQNNLRLLAVPMCNDYALPKKKLTNYIIFVSRAP